MPKKSFPLKEHILHRDLSWLLFNERVLDQALDMGNPLLERAKFLAIFASNLDEFFMVRVAGLKRLLDLEVNRKDRFGFYPYELLPELKAKIEALINKFYDIYQNKILPDLAKNDVHILKYSQLSRPQKKFIENYFETTLLAITTPMAIDPGHPFPVLPSKTLAFAVNLSRKGGEFFAIVTIPKNVPRLIALPTAKSGVCFTLTEELFREFLPTLFKGYKVKGAALFQVIRDSELSAQTEEQEDLLKSIEEEVKKRAHSQTVYLKVEKGCPADISAWLAEGLSFPAEEIKFVQQDLDLSFLFDLPQKVHRADLLFAPYEKGKIPFENIFARIKEGDFITHLPYQSFYPTVELIRAAALDPEVLAIKMTLYRVNQDSAIVSALMEAAEHNKQVTVLVEIKARFDEANNIRWVRQLEEAGCHVIYGIPGLKVHAKMALIVRREDERISRYVHLSTGNYNEKTAGIYTDIGYFTANEDFAKDVSELFNVITGYAVPAPGKRVIRAPDDLRDYFFTLVDQEIADHKKNNNGLIMIKVNSLEDIPVIEKLYAASQSGVRVKLLVRGICCLLPGVKGLSDNITVKSIVGRFLEHTRIFYFHSNGAQRVFLSSADLMTRNLDRRIEILFEINKDELKNHLKDILDICWKDTEKARVLGPNGLYSAIPAEKPPFNAQQFLLDFYKPK